MPAKDMPNMPVKDSRCNIPWLNGKLHRLLKVKRKRRLYKKAKETNNWTNYKFIQKTCRRSMRKAEWEYINNTITQGLKTNNSKPFWKYIKSRKQDNIGVAPPPPPRKRMVHWCVTARRRLKSSWTSSRVSSPEMVDLLLHTLTLHNTQL